VDTEGWLVNLFEDTENEAERESMYRLLVHIERHSQVNWDAAAQLVRHHNNWINPVEKWFPKSEGKNRQLAELTRYLLGKDDVSLFRTARLHQEGRATEPRSQTGRTGVLQKEEVESFNELGYIRVPEAFPSESALKMQDFMWSELQRLHGIHRQDPAT